MQAKDFFGPFILPYVNFSALSEEEMGPIPPFIRQSVGTFFISSSLSMHERTCKHVKTNPGQSRAPAYRPRGSGDKVPWKLELFSGYIIKL